MGKRPGIVGLGRAVVLRNTAPATEVAAGNGKFDTTNVVEIGKPTSPGDPTHDFNDVAVDNRVLPFPAVPGLFCCLERNQYGECGHAYAPRTPFWDADFFEILSISQVWQFIEDTVHHPCKPSDDFIVTRAVAMLRENTSTGHSHV